MKTRTRSRTSRWSSSAGNEGARLQRCLRSIANMQFSGSWEVIYVDSASTDGSPELAASLGARVLTVQPLRPTAALGRNAGWRSASAPFILFLRC